MPKVVYNKFNRGEVDELALARDEVEKIMNSSSYIENFLPMRLGPMFYRQGMRYLGDIDGQPYLVPFVAATDDTAILEFTNNKLRFWIDDSLLERVATTDTIGDHPEVGPSLWTDASGVGSNVIPEPALAGFFSDFVGNNSTSAKLYSEIATQIGVEHTVEIDIELGSMFVAMGTSGQDSSDIFEGFLSTGHHTLVFTPTSAVTMTLSNSKDYRVRVKRVEYAVAGIEEFVTGIDSSQISTIRYSQSADVIFISYIGGKQLVVERRGKKSWSLIDFVAKDGPFKKLNDTSISLSPADLSGDSVLTASSDYFKPEHIGCLFKLASQGQNVEQIITAQDTGTDSIRVSGIKDDRIFDYSMVGLSGTGTDLTLQRSFDDSTWNDVFTTNQNLNNIFDDGLDNVIVYYRLWCKTGNYSTGSPTGILSYSAGSIDGICKVIEYVDASNVNIQILKDFGAVTTTFDWSEGQWSGVSGYPSANVLYESRLWFAGKTNIWGSVSDGYKSFDRDIEGDSKSIFRTIGYGPVDEVNWLSDSTRLVLGIASDEIGIRSSSFGEVLTQDNINLKAGSSQGSSPVSPVKIDDAIYFAQRSGKKIIEAEYQSSTDSHKALDLMTLHENICKEGIKRIAVARQPETRIFVVLNDGTVRVLLMDKAEDVRAWSRITTNGTVIDVVTLPAIDEDRVYFTVKRDGLHSLEKLSKFSDFKEYPVDSHVVVDAPFGTTLSGYDRFDGFKISVYGDGIFEGNQIVSGGEITIVEGSSQVVFGLPYQANYISNKLSRYSDYSLLNEKSRVYKMGIVGKWVYNETGLNGDASSLQYGTAWNELQSMPKVEDGKQIDDNSFFEEYDYERFEFDGEVNTNNRIYLRAENPCVIMALTYEIKDSVNPASGKRRPK